MNGLIKLSSPATGEFWKVTILHEDEHLLAVDKPSRLLTSPDRYDRDRPNLMRLLHRDIERGAEWARERGIQYLANAHRLDFETSGILLMAKDKPSLVALADQFGAEKPFKEYVALCHGKPPAEEFEVDKKIGPHPLKLGMMRIDPKGGKKSRTAFKVLERFGRFTLIACFPKTGRTHQIRVHLRSMRLPLVGDVLYGGRSLMLSSIKPDYRLKRGDVERPLMGRAALHAASLEIRDPAGQGMIKIESAWPKDLEVAVKYLRKFGSGSVSDRPNPFGFGEPTRGSTFRRRRSPSRGRGGSGW